MRKAKIPIYGKDEAKCPPGLYLALFHGRKPKDQELDDWGTNGPMIGPLQYVHTTYGQHVKIQFTDPARAALYGIDNHEMFTIDDEMLPFGGVWYGDWTVTNITHDKNST